MILDALAEVIVESNGLGFSVQAVADRAGLTHRTVYNHFPTREALCEGFAAHVEELLSTLGPSPDAKLSLETFTSVLGAAYRGFGAHELHVRAYAMLMVASRGPVKLWRERTKAFEDLIARDTVVPPPLTPRHVTAAVRMFVSSTGWHLLTEQLGLSSEDAAATATWATKTMLDAVTPRKSSIRSRKSSNRGAHDRQRRRR
jgi:AcrR family transcriptional regulator